MAAMAVAAAPHALVVPFPASGHLNPLVLLSRRLHSMGFVITFLNMKQQHDRIFKHNQGSENGIVGSKGFRFMSVPDLQLNGVRLQNNLQEFLNALEGIRGDVENILQQLMEDSTSPPVTCIISDAFIAWTQDVANKFGICRVSVWTTSASWGLVSLNLQKLQANGFLPATNTNGVLDFIPGVPHIKVENLPETIREDDPDDPGFKLKIRRNSILKDDAWVFVNTFRDLEADVLDQLAIQAPCFAEVGPLFPPEEDDDDIFRDVISPWKVEGECLEWLDNQDASSVLYISFGSLATLPLEQLKEISIGLEGSQCNFLWVIRLDLMDDEVQRNEVMDLVKNNKRGMIISWAPQIKVLRHPSVGAFLTHCGWNSLMEALSSGVPVLTWPCFAEQKFNSVMAVEHWKVGLHARRHEGIVGASIIEEVIRELNESDAGKQVRNRARELGRAAAQCVKEGGSSYRNLEAFHKDMTNRAK